MVFAVDYIRNLREETLKGIHGRLKQGILPRNAPIGYLDCGAGKPKSVDPVRGPLVRQLFDRYAMGTYTLRMLADEGVKLGLRNRNGNPVRLTQVHTVLRNPFYAGILRSSRFGIFPGAHEPLVTRATFDRVQAVLSGKFVRRTKRHVLLFRRMLHCKTCGRSLIGSEIKGFVYYRCSRIECPTTSVREDVVESHIRSLLRSIQLNPSETALVENELSEHEQNVSTLQAARSASLKEALSAANARLSRLTDLLVDAKIDTAAHDERRQALVMERQDLERAMSALDDGTAETIRRARRIVELSNRAENLYESADSDRKRELLQVVMSNCRVSGKTLEFSLFEPFASFAKSDFQQTCAPDWYTNRTFSTLHLLRGVADRWEALRHFFDSIEFARKIEPAV
jgi:hypothetical protein